MQIKWRLLAVALFLFVGQAAQAQVTRIWLLSAGSQERGTHLWIEKAQPSATSGKLFGIIAGHSLPENPSVPTDKLIVDANGYVTGGTLPVPAKRFRDIGGSSLDLELSAGATLTIDTQTGVTLSKEKARVWLPFGKNNKTQPSLGLTSDLVFKTNGDIQIKIDNAQLANKSELDLQRLHLAGFSLKGMDKISVLWDHKPGDNNDTFSCTIGTVTVGVPLPGVLAQDDQEHGGGIDFTATNLKVDSDGQLTSTGDLTMTSAMGVVLPLAKPMDFVLTVHKFVCSLANSTITPKNLEVDLTLPASFTTDDDQNPDRVTVPGIQINNTGDLFVQQTKTLTCRWHGFKLKATNLTIDLSESQGKGAEGTSEKWEGLKVGAATLVLPDKVQTVDHKLCEVAVSEAFVDEHGFTGTAEGTNLGQFTIEGFTTRLDHVKLKVERNEVQDSLLEGLLKGFPGWDGDLKLKGELSATGAFGLEVATSAPITLTGLHAKLQIDQGQLAVDPNGTFSLLASGNVTLDDDVDTVGGAIFRFNNIGIDKNGDFIGDREQSLWMDLPEPLVKEFGPLTLSVAKVGIGKQKRDPSDPKPRWFVAFDGGVSLAGDLPMSIGGDFEGLYVWENTAPGGGMPDIDFKGLHVDLGIDDILTLEGDLTTEAAELPVSKQTVDVKDKNGKKVRYVSGEISLGLPCLKTAAPFEANLKLLVAPRSWYVLGGATLPAPILLGQSGLSLGGFFAGIGHNVRRYPANAVGIPTVNYDLVPDPDKVNPETVDFTFTAGTRLLTSIPTPATPALWGDVALTVDVNPVSVSLNGNVFLADPATGDEGIPADPMKKSRVLTGSIGLRTQPDLEFYAHLGVDINFPTREKWIAKETGAVDLTLNKDGFAVHAGGPIRADNQSHTIEIDNPLEIKLNLPGLGELAPLQGALTFDAYPTKGGQRVPISLQNPPDGMKAAFAAAARWKQPFSVSGSASVGIDVDYSASGTIDLEAYLGAEAELLGAPATKVLPVNGKSVSLPAQSGYFYGNAWAKASVQNAKITASWWKFNAELTANLTGWLEGQLAFYYGPPATVGGALSLEGDIQGSVSAKLGPKSITLPVSAHHKIEKEL